ncbi:Transcriptional regulatory protein liaR [Nitrolancea hollandica Lb]|uniref:Transcriptional regulatory protein liaR n=1 Tax=Nitrolancea hollandica Lb TaxID=1129897 RepID=I4EFN7_9BACT|nr:Transcriptional regulatory protein liaR [Nitrolancea hollandica Lb]
MLLVDDHTLFREGLAALLSYHDDFAVVGEASDAEGALTQAHTLHPDLVLMDIDMPGEDGVIATRRLKEALPDIAVVMVTVHDDTDKLLEAIKAGAQGYLLKNIRSTELIDQLRGLARGEAAISRRIATRMLEEFRRQDEPAEPEAELTTRELEVLELVAARLSNKEIAAKLFISEHTVKNHIKNVLGKLHLRSRRQAAAYGMARGWIRPTRGRR